MSAQDDSNVHKSRAFNKGGYYDMSMDDMEGIAPEIKMFGAIIERAGFDLDLAQPADQCHRYTAKGWFLSTKRTKWSFLWVAEQLSLSQDTIDRLVDKARKTKVTLTGNEPKKQRQKRFRNTVVAYKGEQRLAA